MKFEYKIKFVYKWIDLCSCRFHDKKNKPSAILLERGEVKVRQTSSQMWCLLRLLPFMIGSVIGKGDEKWEVYLQLREIVEYIFSPVTTESSTYVLEWLVQVHHENFLSVRWSVLSLRDLCRFASIPVVPFLLVSLWWRETHAWSRTDVLNELLYPYNKQCSQLSSNLIIWHELIYS